MSLDSDGLYTYSGGAAGRAIDPSVLTQPHGEPWDVRLQRKTEEAMTGDPRQSDLARLSLRVFDVVISSIALIVFLPLIGLICLIVALESDGPIFFVQHRVGLNGKMFPCLKFRSMVENSQEVLEALLARDEQIRIEWERDHKLRNDPRISRIGKLLRKSSLDELPQLLNVLRGDMSIVGPRPIIRDEIHRYGAYFADYCSVRPGITGLWQVSGRSDLSYDERVKLDSIYASKKSLLTDIIIMLRTIPAVVAAKGSY